jgi:hypothetical protein
VILSPRLSSITVELAGEPPTGETSLRRGELTSDSPVRSEARTGLFDRQSTCPKKGMGPKKRSGGQQRELLGTLQGAQRRDPYWISGADPGNGQVLILLRSESLLGLKVRRPGLKTRRTQKINAPGKLASSIGTLENPSARLMDQMSYSATPIR